MTIPTENKEVKQEAAPPQDSAKEQNFSQIRKLLEQERAARLAAEQKAAQLERSRSTNQSPDDEDIESEPYVDHRKLEKKFKKFEMSLEEKIDKRAEEKARMMIEQERQQIFLKDNKDFEEIMREEHVQKFADRFPTLAQGLLKIQDPFERQKMVYENIKALGVHKKEVPDSSVQDKINQNRRGAFYHPTGIGNPPGSHGTAGKDYSDGDKKNAFDKVQQLKKNLRLG